MNVNTNFQADDSAPTEKTAGNKALAMVEAQRRQLQADQEELNTREANLRAYEARLRKWQDEIESARVGGPATQRTTSPFQRPVTTASTQDAAECQAGWDKLHRAREIFEAEQAHLRNDRFALRDHELDLKRREEELVARDERLVAREAAVAAAESQLATVPAQSSPSQQPFSLARFVLRSSRSS